MSQRLLISSLPGVLVLCMTIGASVSTAATASSAGDAALFKRLDTDADGRIDRNEVSREHEALFARLVRKGDENGDQALSRKEFLAALVPSRPEKPLEEKQPASSPQADAVRYLLLTLDTSGDGRIEVDEIPDALGPVFDQLVERVDRSGDRILDRYELGRAPGPLAQVATRYAARERIDVAAELTKLQKTQGDAVNRFEEQPRPLLESLGDPKQVRTLFTRLDRNGDKRIEASEVPEPFQPQIKRFLRIADRDRNGSLSQREFLLGAERLGRFVNRRPPSPAQEAKRSPKPRP